MKCSSCGRDFEEFSDPMEHGAVTGDCGQVCRPCVVQIVVSHLVNSRGKEPFRELGRAPIVNGTAPEGMR